MHGSYRRAFGPESVLELHKNIIIQHEDYLKQDDSDKKADALRYMAGYVVQYLHLVPQEKKFTFKETDRVLHNSAMNIAEFDPREGSIAFCNLAKYAENLLEQPWRKDFHVIKLTSGFYVHNISAQLQNAHEILIVMGYVNLDETTLKLLPNHQSNLKAVSRDCYVASQECLILSQIWQHVADQEPDYPLTIGEVFEYRKNHLGDTDTICNKLLYDIRARMHALKLQQQRDLQHLHHNQKIPPHPQQYGYPHQSTFSSSHLPKNPHRFVPVDRLIDFDTDPQDSTNPIDELDRLDGLLPERERNSSNLPIPTAPTTSDQFKNLNLYQDDDHMYDPVYSGEGDLPPMIPNHHANHQQYPPSRKLSSQYGAHQQKPVNNGGNLNPSSHHPQYFYNNQTSSRKSVPANMQPSSAYLQHHNNFNTNTTSNMYGQDRNSSVSPMIPKTVTSLFSKSNSMNSIANGTSSARGPSSSSSSSSQQPLTRSKIKETDLDNPDLISMNPRDAIPAYLLNDSHNRRTRKSMPAVIPTQSNNQVYPDQYYPPGIVKPVAVYGNPTPAAAAPAPPSYYSATRTRDRLHSDHSEDVLNEAYEYASEVGQLPKSQSQTVQSSLSPYQHQATPIPPPGEGGASSSSDRQSSSPPSLGSGGNSGRKQSAPVPPLKRPSRIDLRGGGGSIKYADSVSPELHTPRNGGYRDLGSGSGSSSGGDGGSPASSTNSSSLLRQYPRNEELNSLDTVYYDYLLKQGQTDEVLGVSSPRKDNHYRNVNEDTGNTSSGHHRRQGSTSRSASSSVTSHSSHQSSHHHQHRSNQNNYEEDGEEDNHIYDGRRVVPKKTQNNEGGTVRRRQAPGEGAIPSSSSSSAGQNNFNLVGNNGDGGKPSYQEKQLTGHGQRGSKGRRNKLIAEENEYQTGGGDEVNDGSPELPQPIKPVEPWDCRFCTFKNLVEERICEVCAKSKDFFEDVEPVVLAASGGGDAGVGNNLKEQHIVLPKMYSVPNTNVTGAGRNDGGGDLEEEERECPQCTLLNPVRARVCDACNFRLKPVESPRSLTEVDMEGYDNR